jgi:hypothetical protein
VRSAYASRETPIGSKTAFAEFAGDPLPPDTLEEIERNRKLLEQLRAVRLRPLYRKINGERVRVFRKIEL